MEADVFFSTHLAGGIDAVQFLENFLYDRQLLFCSSVLLFFCSSLRCQRCCLTLSPMRNSKQRIRSATPPIGAKRNMDRMNISLAMAGGMNQDLHLSMTRSGLAAGVFFIGYVLPRR
jgi:hypothetical protein